MMKLEAALQAISLEMSDLGFVRPEGGDEILAALDLYLEAMAVWKYQTSYFPQTELSSLTNDSRQVRPGGMFVAIPGAAADGAQFIDSAIQNGARVVVVSANTALTPRSGILYCLISPEKIHLAYAKLCSCFYGDPARQLNCHAITGTNGKTTTALLVEHLFQHLNHPCGLISTVEYRLGNGNHLEADRTTPEAGTLQRYFRTMCDNHLSEMVMEVSSHALVQERIGALQFQSAVFTNLTGDHLDYHKTMENYFAAKSKLFFEHLAPGGVAILNGDDPYGKKLAAQLRQNLPDRSCVWTFGQSKENDFVLEKVDLELRGSSFELRDQRPGYEKARPIALETPLIGLHNLYNLVGALLTVYSSCPDWAAIRNALHAAPFQVPGRLEAFHHPNGSAIFVDYAHTDDALKNVLTILRKIATRRVFTVFGCGGDRDRTKRPRMAREAAAQSDFVILTSDNPRTENPEAILAEIQAGFPADFQSYTVIADRKQAIAHAIALLEPHDILLIAGKGHETYQEINHVKHPFDDRAIVREILQTAPNVKISIQKEPV